MDIKLVVDVISIAVSVAALGLGGFSVWLALHLYSKAKDAERNAATSLEAIRTQVDMLQRLTGRWMDRFTRHATEPRPADEGLMQLIQVVAQMPTEMLAHIEVLRPQPQVEISPQRALEIQEPWIQESVLSYATLYWYMSMANALARALLPRQEDFDPANNWHVWTRKTVDKTAREFQHIRGVIGRVHQTRLDAQGVKPWLDEANASFAPYVSTVEQAWAAQRGS